MLQLDKLFYQGSYQEILSQTLDTPEGEWPRRQVCYVIGALCFVGRVDDALVLLRKHMPHAAGKGAADLNDQTLAAARFFISIGLVRVSRYDEGQAFVVANLVALRGQAATGSISRFYVFQGLAFYRFFQGRYALALRSVKHAWEAALEADYPYGKAMASDMRGHVLVRTGQIATGLKALEESARLCERYGLQAQGHVVRTAQFYYQAAHGIFAQHTIPELEKFIASFSPEDNFTLAVAHAELARQLCIRGQVRLAEKYLEEAARVILKAGHRRHKIMVLHRFAHNRYYMGRLDEALEYLDKAHAECDLRYDLEYLVSIEGLRFKVNRRLGLQTEAQCISVTHLTQRVRSGLARNAAWRDMGIGQPTLTGDDLLGDLRHRCRLGPQTPYADVLAILRSGLLGFLHEIIPLGRQARVVCFDLLPRRMTIFDDGDVRIDDEPVSHALKSIALQIARSPCSKRDLIESHWGFNYHPLRHDPMVYAVINRLRRALGAAAHWLQYDGTTYGWAPDVQVFTYEAKGYAAVQSVQTATTDSDWLEPASPVFQYQANINHRQMAILTEVERRAFINVQDCVKLFSISRITAARDLGELCQKGLLKRVGRGRATHYHLLPASSNNKS